MYGMYTILFMYGMYTILFMYSLFLLENIKVFTCNPRASKWPYVFYTTLYFSWNTIRFCQNCLCIHLSLGCFNLSVKGCREKAEIPMKKSFQSFVEVGVSRYFTLIFDDRFTALTIVETLMLIKLYSNVYLQIEDSPS